MLKIKEIFLVKQFSIPDYYLGNHYCFEDKNKLWTYDCNKYYEEAVRRVEKYSVTIRYYKTPYPTKDVSPELDNLALLTPKQHRYYQQLISMGIWLVLIGRPDV